jgi:hypothetical protein
MIRRIFLALLLVSPIALLSDAKPTQPPKTPVQKAPVQKLPLMTNWGEINQDGAKFTITGHPRWEAEGEIKDGKAYIMWTRLCNSHLSPGVYQIIVVDGVVQMHGAWGYIEDVQIDRQQGTIIGDLDPDSIYQLPDPEPDI